MLRLLGSSPAPAPGWNRAHSQFSATHRYNWPPEANLGLSWKHDSEGKGTKQETRHTHSREFLAALTIQDTLSAST